MLLDLWPQLEEAAATSGGASAERYARRTYHDRGFYGYTIQATATARVEASGHVGYGLTAAGAGRPRAAGGAPLPAPVAISATPAAARSAAAVNLTTHIHLALTDQRHIEPDWLLLDLLDE